MAALALFIAGARASSFPWGDGVLIHGAYMGRVKVTDADSSHEGDPAGSLTCDVGGTWPYGTTALDAVYLGAGPGDYDARLLSLDSARDTLDILQDHSINLYIADVDGSCMPADRSHATGLDDADVEAVRACVIDYYEGTSPLCVP